MELDVIAPKLDRLLGTMIDVLHFIRYLFIVFR
jgi:hypothetical protein